MWCHEVAGIIRISLVLILVANSLVTHGWENKSRFFKDLPKKEREKYEDLLKKAVIDHRGKIMRISYEEREEGREALLEITKNKEIVLGFFSKYFMCYLHFYVAKNGDVHTVRGFAKNQCVPKFDKSSRASTIDLYHKQLDAYKHVGVTGTEKTPRRYSE